MYTFIIKYKKRHEGDEGNERVDTVKNVNNK